MHFIFYNDTSPTEIYTLSLHDALPILSVDVEDYFQVSAFDEVVPRSSWDRHESRVCANTDRLLALDRKSTRLNSSHSQISYAVFCLKKKIRTITTSRL